MSVSHRICETCVYCSFAGNCDRYNKPLTSIEQPACDAYEIHPLLAENAELRELVRHMFTCLEHYEQDGSVGCEHCPLDNDAGNCDYERRMRELGVSDHD